MILIIVIVLGGCKHVVTLLSWLHRRSEDPPKTSTQCYWKRSKMAAIGTTMKFIKASDLGKAAPAALPQSDGSFLKSVIDSSIELGVRDIQLLKYFVDPTVIENLSLHNMICNFLYNDVGSTSEDFLKYCQQNMNTVACQRAAQMTVGQSNCPLWHNLRYARITASKAHEAAHCQTMEGSLVESILGAKLVETKFLRRGRVLEAEVLKEVEEILQIKFEKCGLILSNQHPFFGASPDAIGENYIVEVKCPSSDTALRRYFTVAMDKPCDKYMAQMQLQMHFAKKCKGMYCVAKPDFESSKEVIVCYVEYDQNYCLDLMDKCLTFWSQAIYKKLKFT